MGISQATQTFLKISEQRFLIANMTIPENAVTTSGLVVEGGAGRFLQARAFAVL